MRISLRVLHPRGLPGLRHPQLHGMRHVHPRAHSRALATPPPLAGGQPADQLQVPRVQEELLVGRVPRRTALRVVRHDGEQLIADTVSAHDSSSKPL